MHSRLLKKSIKLLSIFSIFSLFTLLSCQKEINPLTITARTDSTAADDSTTLIKYVDLSPVGADTFIVHKYTYDNLKRVTKSEYIMYDSLGVPENNYTLLLFYNGTDTLPYKKIDTDISLPGTTATTVYTSYYTYANGKIISDSGFYPNPTVPSCKKYSYTSNKIEEKELVYFPTVFSTVRNFYVTKANGNTTQQRDTFPVLIIDNFTFSYDNKKNPFYGLPEPFAYRSGPYYFMETYSEEMVHEKNNPVDINEFHSTQNFHFKYEYTYKANGYPSSAKIYDVVNNPTSFYKRVFTYTKL